MIIALTAILTLWVVAALALAFAGGSRNRTAAAVNAALASTETIRGNQAAWAEYEAEQAARRKVVSAA